MVYGWRAKTECSCKKRRWLKSFFQTKVPITICRATFFSLFSETVARDLNFIFDRPSLFLA